MSDLHKTFLRRIKQQEQAFGLSLLSENVESDTVEEEEEEKSDDGVENVRSSEEVEENDNMGKEHGISAAVIPTLVDNEIRANLDKFKSQYFTIIEDYTTDQGVSFKSYYRQPASTTSPLFICVHGAGSSAMTFGKLVENLSLEDVGVFAYDLRGHGGSSSTSNFSMEILVEDFHFIFNRLVSKYSLLKNTIYLVGHSLGGAVLARYSKTYPDSRFRGLVLLDIVEETAVKSLHAMPQFIANRPLSFPSYTRAIDWHMNRLLFNRESATLSVCDLMEENKIKTSTTAKPSNISTTIKESSDSISEPESAKFYWKTDLKLTSPYWDTWFTRLSQNFLDFKGPKLLLLSTHEALDKDLIIGQMQGKYQLVTFNNNHQSGHFAHEDLPLQVAACLIDFIKRNESPSKFMRDELGIVPKWGGKINK